jgi:hypothetical protein
MQLVKTFGCMRKTANSNPGLFKSISDHLAHRRLIINKEDMLSGHISHCYSVAASVPLQQRQSTKRQLGGPKYSCICPDRESVRIATTSDPLVSTGLSITHSAISRSLELVSRILLQTKISLSGKSKSLST